MAENPTETTTSRPDKRRIMRHRVTNVLDALAVVMSNIPPDIAPGTRVSDKILRVYEKRRLEVSTAASVVESSNFVPEPLKAAARARTHAMNLAVGACIPESGHRAFKLHAELYRDMDEHGVTAGMRAYLARTKNQVVQPEATKPYELPRRFSGPDGDG